VFCGHHVNQPRDSYDDDNSHVAVVTQSVVQDILWLHQAAQAISGIRVPAYFVKRDTRRYFAIVTPTKAFMDEYDAAWRRLTRDGEVHLRFHDQTEGANAVKQKPKIRYDIPEYAVLQWANLIRNCTIVEHPDTVSELAFDHSVEDHEVVLSCTLGTEVARVLRAKTFATRVAADKHFKASVSH
jgi:hypothetical protein